VGQLYTGTTQIFYEIANAFFWPVAIALLCLLAFALADLGALLAQVWSITAKRQPILWHSASALHRVTQTRSARCSPRRNLVSFLGKILAPPSNSIAWGRLRGERGHLAGRNSSARRNRGHLPA